MSEMVQLNQRFKRRPLTPDEAVDEPQAQWPPETDPMMTEPLSYKDPYGAADRFRQNLTDDRGRDTLRLWRGDYYIWTATHYRAISTDNLTKRLYEFLRKSVVAIADKDAAGKPTYKLVRYVPDQTKVMKILHALRGLVLIDDHTEAPTWPDDADSIDTLQEWFGYNVSGRTEQEKALLLIGPKRGGKGTILNALEALLGKENTAAPTLTSLRGEFGMQPLIGKSIALITDARLDLTQQQTVLIERLLRIIADDTIQINRKNREEWIGKLHIRLTVAANEVPKMVDTSEAIVSRWIALQLTKSFEGTAQDKTLKRRLLTELPGILNWALDGLPGLDERGEFLIPTSAQPIMERLSDMASNTKRFGEECCDFGTAHWVNREEIFPYWTRWCSDEGLHPGSKEEFGRKLEAAFPLVRAHRPRKVEDRPRGFCGLRMKAEVSSRWTTKTTS
jgi:P4 family phage/plasmid primase-like protien